MSFAEYQRERTQERVRQSEHPSIFPAKDIPLAVFRRRSKNGDVKKLVAEIRAKGVEAVLPAALLKEDAQGRLGIDLTVLDNPGMDAARELRALPGGRELVRLLNEDYLLDGDEAIEIEKFRKDRFEVAKEVGAETVTGLVGNTNFKHDLVGVEHDHSYTSEEEKSAFKTIQDYAQKSAEEAFAATGLTNVRPKAYVTRSNQVNGWIFDAGREGNVAEYLDMAAKSPTPVELPIFVHFGLVERAKSKDELVGVLSHEIAHLLQPTYLGNTDNTARQRLEYDADAVGQRLADAAGYNPRGLGNFLQREIPGSQEQKFGFGTHPDTNRRIVESEKEFHRTDLPLPNAAKPETAVPAEVAIALQDIKDIRSKIIKPFGKGKNPDDARILQDERKLFADHRPELLLSVDAQEVVEEQLNQRLHRAMAEQELIHDTTGQRTQLFAELKTLILTLNDERKKLGDREKITVHLPALWNRAADWSGKDQSQILGALPDSVLDTPARNNWFTPLQSEELLQISRQHTAHLEQQNKQKYEDSDRVRAATLEDWLDPNNPDVQPFWGEVAATLGGEKITDLSREERLFYLHALLTKVTKPYVNNGGSYYNPPLISIVKHGFKIGRELDYSQVVDTVSQANLLDAVPLHLRAQRRTEMAKPEKVPTKEVETPTGASIYRMDETHASDKLKTSVWAVADSQPESVRDYARLTQEQTIQAYAEVLRKEGKEPAPELLKYCTEVLFKEDVLETIPDLSINFLAQALEILKTRNLATVFGEEGSKLYTKQHLAIEKLQGILAFALEASTTQEQQIQTQYRREYELQKDTSIQISLGELERFAGVKWNKTYVKEGHGKKRKDLWVYSATVAASDLSIWSENQEIVTHLLNQGEFKALQIPKVWEEAAPKPGDAQIIKDSVGRYCSGTESIASLLEAKLAKFPAIIRAYCDNAYQHGFANQYVLNKQYEQEQRFLRDPSHVWGLVTPLVQQVVAEIWAIGGGKLQTRLGDKIDRKYQSISLEDVTRMVTNLVSSSLGMVDRVRHARFMAIDAPSLEQAAARTNVPTQWEDGEHPILYKPLDYPGAVESNTLNKKEDLLEYLAIMGDTHPGTRALMDTIQAWPKDKKFPSALASVCLGHLSPFALQYQDSRDISTTEIIKIWRQAAAIYHEDWQNLEQYKCLDEQLSYWEWTQNLSGLVNKRAVDQTNLWDSSHASTHDAKYKLIDGSKNSDTKKKPTEGMSILTYIEKYATAMKLDWRYRTGASENTTIKFSWPLFLTDLWEGNPVFADADERVAEKFQPLCEALKTELAHIIADPTNLETVKNMQPGFYREFLLAKKLEAQKLQTLDDIEPWLEYFTSHPHEASARNQISGLVEASRKGYREERCLELGKQALDEVVAGPEAQWFVVRAGNKEGYSGNTIDQLSDIDIDVVDASRDLYYKLEYLKKQIEGREQKGEPVSASDRTTLAEYETVYARLSRYDVQNEIKKAVYERYAELVGQIRNQAETNAKASESDVLLFSDQVIENDRSRLEVGPVYRYRLAAQKLMDWHANALRGEPEQAQMAALAARVDKVLPEAHPLKDIFIKNQTAVELWQIIKAAVPPEQMGVLGVGLTERSIDLTQVLENFPLQAESSFLKQYSLFELKGLETAITILPRDVAEVVMQKLEKVLQTQISSDNENALRRVLMVLEKKVRWPELRTQRQQDARVFEEYLQRITTLYPEPSIERDDVLESIGMDLALTAEQIRQVSHLTHREQMRWPNPNEAKTLRAQHTAGEQMRGFLGKLEKVERIQYVLWLAGGPTPTAETLSIEKTGIALDDRVNTFWSLTPTERRTILYDLCLGDKGVMEKLTAIQHKDSNKPWAQPESSMGAIEHVADNLFKQAFGEGLIDPDQAPDASVNTRGREMINIIFREMFVHQPAASNRAELMTNMLEAIGAAQREGRQMRPGELIRTLLEQVGVVGIKIGQVLSEQPGLLPESIRLDLLQLKDKTAQFSKRGILSYLESAGWVRGNDSKVSMIGDALGSASIKQVQDGRLEDDTEVAIKAKRPSIDKNYQTDLKVMERVFHTLESKGFAVPSYLLAEVDRVIKEELEFNREVANQQALGASLKERGATLELTIHGDRQAVPLAVSAPLSVSEVLYPNTPDSADIGLIVEEKVKGLSLKEIKSYQTALGNGQENGLKPFRDKIINQYGASRLKEIESRIGGLDLDSTQAALGLEFLRQVTTGGIFHADLHSGNFYLDFTPQVANGEIYNQRAVFIDLGSAGYSKPDKIPTALKKEAEGRTEHSGLYRDFLSALFSRTAKHTEIANIVNQLAGVSWTPERVSSLTTGVSDAGEQTQKIFYAILDEGRGKIDPQFRYFLKAVATAADHLTKMRDVVQAEIAGLMNGTSSASPVFSKLSGEGLLNIAMLL